MLVLICLIYHSYYDILEDRVPAGLVAEYHSLLALCADKFQEFSSLRSDLNSDSESEQDNVSMVEGLRMYEQLESLRRKLRIIENPLLRLVLLFVMDNCHAHVWQQHCLVLQLRFNQESNAINRNAIHFGTWDY